MRYLTLALVAVFGIVTTDVAAQCLGCGHRDNCGTPVTCDYSYLWANYSPSNCRFVPKPGIPCGGCRLGGGGLCGKLAGACHGQDAHATDGCCSEPSSACDGGQCSNAVANTGCGGWKCLFRRYDNCCPPPSPNIGWDGWGQGCGGAGLGGYGGHSLASWNGLGGGGHRLMGGGCDPCCEGSGRACGCALGCHSFNVGWLGSLMERLRNCGSTRAMSYGSLDRCGLLSSDCAYYPAGNLDVSFGCANGNGTSTGNRDGSGADSHLKSPIFHDVEPQLDDSVPRPPGDEPAGTDAKLKLNQVFSLQR